MVVTSDSWRLGVGRRYSDRHHVAREAGAAIVKLTTLGSMTNRVRWALRDGTVRDLGWAFHSGLAGAPLAARPQR